MAYTEWPSQKAYKRDLGIDKKADLLGGKLSSSKKTFNEMRIAKG
jgi:hypothetical protein